MEPLFRLALIRPAIAQDPENPSIRVSQDSPFQTALAQAAQAAEPRPALQQVARDFIAHELFIGEPETTPLSTQLATFAAALERLGSQAVASDVNARRAGSDAVTQPPGLRGGGPPEGAKGSQPEGFPAKVGAAVKQAFGSAPDALVKAGQLAKPMARLRDSLLAIKLVQDEHGRPIEALTNQLRDLELIVRVAQGGFPATREDLHRFRRRSLMLPTTADLRSVLSTRKLEEERRKKVAEAETERRGRAESLFGTYQVLRRAVDELTNMGGDQFLATPQAPHVGFAVPEALSQLGIASRKTAYADRLSKFSLGELNVGSNGDDDVHVEAALVHVQEIASADSVAMLAKTVLADSPRPLASSPAFKPLTLSEVGFRLKATAANALTESTKAALSERKLTLADQPLDKIVAALQEEIGTTSRELDVLYDQPMQRSVKRVGNALVTIATPLPSAWSSVAVGTTYKPLPALPLDQRIPHTRGKVAPAGIADLLVVKQQLTGYETADVAHIENILKGERKQREHTRRRETEEFTFTETETISSEERELESTDRFEMTRETNATIKEDASFKAGLTVSGKYGPTVDFSASAEGAVSRSKEEATKTAATFSQDVTQRSAIKISERVLERASLRVTTEVIEKDVHELNNVAGKEHISGVYQWVNKVYRAQMFNYGLRTMFDFMVPEPAAFLMAALQSAHASAVEIQKPPAFPLKPNEVTETNYNSWVRTYGATDVSPPPEMYKTKSLDFNAGGGDSNTDYNHSGQIAIDEGYRAVHGTVASVWNTWDSKGTIDAALGSRTHRFTDSGSWVWTVPLSDERDSLPFAMNTFRLSDVAVAVEVKCQRTERAMEKWRLDTHAKLTTAYKARLAEYEEKLAALELQAGVAIEGRNPALNLEIMQDELKKNCISILSDQHYDLFHAIDFSASGGLPQIDVFEAEGEGAYVRFFEQAFEWEHMTWLAYPYFWGRKNQWDERLAFEDPDPLFNQFLKAGYCRVSVPARLGFEGAIDHFMTYGELWNGGPLPPISSPLYLPIADEIAEQLDRPGDEVPQGEPWMVRIPTTLVHLRPDDKLPKWVQNASGDWAEA
jgi:hypothetical protein